MSDFVAWMAVKRMLNDDAARVIMRCLYSELHFPIHFFVMRFGLDADAEQMLRDSTPPVAQRAMATFALRNVWPWARNVSAVFVNWLKQVGKATAIFVPRVVAILDNGEGCEIMRKVWLDSFFQNGSVAFVNTSDPSTIKQDPSWTTVLIRGRHYHRDDDSLLRFERTLNVEKEFKRFLMRISVDEEFESRRIL